MEDHVKRFVTCYIMRQRICALCELEISFPRSKGKETYDQLLLGPILQHQVIIREFHPPPHVNVIHKVTTLACVKALINAQSFHRGGKGGGLAPCQIAECMATNLDNVDIPELELCVKFGNIGQLRNILYSRDFNLEDKSTT